MSQRYLKSERATRQDDDALSFCLVGFTCAQLRESERASLTKTDNARTTSRVRRAYTRFIRLDILT